MNVTQQDIFAVIKAAGVSVDLSKIDASASLTKSGIDSLEMMNVFLGIEERFGIRIPDDDADRLDSVDAIVDYLQKL